MVEVFSLKLPFSAAQCNTLVKNPNCLEVEKVFHCRQLLQKIIPVCMVDFSNMPVTTTTIPYGAKWQNLTMQQLPTCRQTSIPLTAVCV
ncbi:hypothetical protein T10_2939 [Trichinella papuae]|uniref:Uncharacterized protein n=1 Tax=Trichinella papuae TaxID=268474 RepID=A0A0V1MC19_9BILA|nr:hypothetical protein T10_2939 [Trichinella papuae]